METYLFWIVPIASLLALVLAWYFYKQMMRESEGTPTMEKIALYVRQGAMSYLKQQYKVVGMVFLGLVILFSVMAYGFHLQNAWVPVAFLTGGFFSGLSGFLGMKTATYASARTANAARSSLNKGLRIAFRSGAVMGLVVVGLGLFDISFWYLLLDKCIPADVMNPSAKLCIITTTMLTFGMGASTQALFARVGGGIYTKAADVGADLVGKVEAGIPEDDPRNPATIADNVGDNVGDVAGMGADLYESYCGSILATAALGAAAYIGTNDTTMQFKAVIAPMLIAAVGILLSIIGIFSVRTKENAGMKELLGSLAVGTNLSSALIVVATFLILWILNLQNWVNISFAVVVGLIVGIIIGRSTEYYTSQSYKPTQRLAESGKTGPATVIISGIGLGMVSTTIPVLAVVVGIILSYWLASGFDFANISMGLYGIGIAAVGMLSTGETVTLKVNEQARRDTEKNHSATHLLQKALKTVLGSHVEQKGSLVTPDRLRFDFAHFQAMTPEEIAQTETLVNKEIQAALPVVTDVMNIEEAKKSGAMALFGEKYDQKVRVVSMGDFSKELCGGTHVKNTSSIMLFKIVSEAGIAAGVRRIEALTGNGVIEYYKKQETMLQEVAKVLKAQPAEITEKITHLQAEVKSLQSENESLKSKLAQGSLGDVMNQIVDVKGVKLLAAKVEGVDMNGLRDLGDQLKEKIGEGVVVLAAVNGGKVNLLAMATDAAQKAGAHAGNLIKGVAAIVGGGGGGRPNMAQAGGKNPEKADEAVKAAVGILEQQLH